MTCYAPLTGYKSKHLTKKGKRKIVFNVDDGYKDLKVEVPCGQCIGCRLDKSRQWAVRCVHEASLYEDNSFITLTYNNENLPSSKSVNKKVLQDFFKRYRKEIDKHDPGRKIRFMACGEYGDLRNRPHYHAIIFNWRDPYERLWSKSKTGELLFRSPTLESAWKYGHSIVGSVTFESAAYVARYVTKKITGKRQESEYRIFDKETGEINEIEPEFALMSLGRRSEIEELDQGGIGYKWFKKYYETDCQKDFITVNRTKIAIPDYYYRLLEKKDPERYKEIKKLHIKKAKERKEENEPKRLAVRERIQKRKLEMLTRQLEEL